MSFYFTMSDLQGNQDDRNKAQGGMSESEHPAVKSKAIPYHDDDEDTALLSSFASMMMSSMNTLSEPSLFSSVSSMHTQRKDELHLLHTLHRNEYECLGYLQLQACVLSFSSIPTELAILSQKTILYIETSLDAHTKTVESGDIFTHPLILEAMESLFVPIAIVPSHLPSTDFLHVAKIGFIDTSGHDVLPPISSEHLSTGSILVSMLQVLRMNQQLVPSYLQNMVDDSVVVHRRTTERCVCFGFPDLLLLPTEEELTVVDGVRSVQWGRFRNDEDSPVVECQYDSKATSFSTLVKHVLTKLQRPPRQIIVYCYSNDERMAARLEIIKLSQQQQGLDQRQRRQVAIVSQNQATTVFEPEMDRTALRQTPLRFVPMTFQQAERAHRLFAERQYDRATNLFSPRQTQFLVTAIQGDSHEFHDVLDYPILEAWMSNVEKRPPQRIPEEEPSPSVVVQSEPEVYYI